jgi:hypothetical protein
LGKEMLPRVEKSELNDFHLGIEIPEHGVFLPWLISESELYLAIPRDHFSFSSGGWPLLRFTALGIDAIFGFNFVTDPSERLLQIMYSEFDDQLMEERFSRWSLILANHLPEPTCSDEKSQMWYDDKVVIDHSIRESYDPEDLKYTHDSYALSISFRPAWPH